MLCNRSNLAEALSAIPYKEQPTREVLEGYVQRYPQEEDLAWSNLYPKLASWISDREVKKKRADLEEAGVIPNRGISRFNYQKNR